MPEIGVPEIAGIGFLAFVLREVFAFILKVLERRDAAAKPDKDERTYSLMDRQTDLMEKLVPLIEQIHNTTENYDKSGVCPLTKPEGRDSVARAIGREIKSED